MKVDTYQHDLEGPLSRLFKAHTALAHIMMQIDGLVLKAYKMSTNRQIGGLDLHGFSQFLEMTASSLQEWIPKFEDATHRVNMQCQSHEQGGPSLSLQGEQKAGAEESTARHGKLSSSLQSEALLDVTVSIDDTILLEKENMLSNSPLVPWLDRAQFFILTPMAKHKKKISPILLRRCSSEEQQTLQSSSPLVIGTPRAPCMHLQDIEAIPTSPSLLIKLSSKEDERVSDNIPVSESSTPSPLHHQSIDSPDMLATPLPPQSLVKRYSNFFEADDQFADSPPILLVTPIVKQNQASQHKSAKEEEEECTEITEYFTAFSPPRSITPNVSISGRNSASSSCDMVDARTPDSCHEGLQSNVERSTPLLPQSLMKRYSLFLNPEVNNEMTTDSMMLLTPMLVGSPPKTCILMRANHKEDSVRSRHSLQTPLLLLKSPFKTPGLFLRKADDHECYEDMDLTSLKKPCQPPRPPQSVRRTPSSDMQFATIRRAPASMKRTPLVDLQLSTLRKPGAPLPGEQTLKRELWCRMEAEFTSIANVCKSLFTDNQMDAPADAETGIKNKENWFVPRGLQQRGSNLYK